MFLSLICIAVGVQQAFALAQDPVFILTSPGDNLASSCPNRNVFVSSKQMLYRLSSELQLLQNVTIPASTVGLTTTVDGNWLVACFNTSSCAVYNTSDLTIINFTVTSGNIFPPGSSNIALFSAPISGIQNFYIGSGEKMLGGKHRFRLLQQGFAGSEASREFTSGNAVAMFLPEAGAPTRQIYGGFQYKNRSYFLALNSHVFQPQFNEVFIIRACSDGFNAIHEVQLLCHGLSSVTKITGVSEVAGTLVMSVDDRVCSYDLAEINMIMDNYFRDCFGATFISTLVNRPSFGPQTPCATMASVSPDIITITMIKQHFQCIYLLQQTDHPTLCDFKTTGLILEAKRQQLGRVVLISTGVNSSLAIMVNSSSLMFVGHSNSSGHFVDMVSVQNPLHVFSGYF